MKLMLKGHHSVLDRMVVEGYDDSGSRVQGLGLRAAKRKRCFRVHGLGGYLCRELPTETKVEGGTSQSNSGTSVDLDKSGFRE